MTYSKCNDLLTCGLRRFFLFVFAVAILAPTLPDLTAGTSRNDSRSRSSSTAPTNRMKSAHTRPSGGPVVTRAPVAETAAPATVVPQTVPAVPRAVSPMRTVPTASTRPPVNQSVPAAVSPVVRPTTNVSRVEPYRTAPGTSNNRHTRSSVVTTRPSQPKPTERAVTVQRRTLETNSKSTGSGYVDLRKDRDRTGNRIIVREPVRASVTRDALDNRNRSEAVVIRELPQREVETDAQDSERLVYRMRRERVERETLARNERARAFALAHRQDNQANRSSASITVGGHDHGHTHRHGTDCGHYRYDNRWHDYPQRHVHGRNCGHRYSGGIWVSVGLGHRHGPGCGHFQDNGIWLSHTGSAHRHRTGCGHYFYGGIWNNYPSFHAHRSGCGHYYYEGGWHNFAVTHVHSDHCGHLYDGASWIVVGSRSHRHGAGCGHYYFRDRWYGYPRQYYTRYRSDSFYFFVDLGSYSSRRLPRYVYQDSLSRYRSGAVDVFESADPLSSAYARFAEGNYYGALLHFNDAIRDDPDDGLLLLARAQSRIAVGDYRLAYDDLVEGMSRIPEWADVEFSISEIYSNKDDLAEHIESLEEWLENNPRDFKAHFVLGYVYYFHQDYLAAKNELVYVLAWNNEHAQANALMERSLKEEAESEIKTYESPELMDEPEATTE